MSRYSFSQHAATKGFTLIELVVVIAILGILAGIAIPRFLDAQASAKGAKIVADLRHRQCGHGLLCPKRAISHCHYR